MKKKTCIALCMASALLFSACNICGKEFVWDINSANGHTVFSVNGEKYNLSEVKIYLCNYKNLYGIEYDVDLWKYDFKDQSLNDYVKAVTLEEVTRIASMNMIAESKGISLTKKEMKKVEEAAEEYYKSLSDYEIDYMDVNESDIKDAYEKYALAQKIYKSLVNDVNTEVSDDDARVITIQQIYVTNSDSANAIAQKLAAGEDFSKLEGYNEAGSMEMDVKRGQLPKAVEEVAFELDNNEISEMIKVDNGFYFIKCISKLNPEQTEKNKANILVEREQEEFNDDYNSFIKSSEFELNEDLWKNIDISKESKIKTDSFFEVYNKHFENVE